MAHEKPGRMRSDNSVATLAEPGGKSFPHLILRTGGNRPRRRIATRPRRGHQSRAKISVIFQYDRGRAAREFCCRCVLAAHPARVTLSFGIGSTSWPRAVRHAHFSNLTTLLPIHARRGKTAAANRELGRMNAQLKVGLYRRRRIQQGPFIFEVAVCRASRFAMKFHRRFLQISLLR